MKISTGIAGLTLTLCLGQSQAWAHGDGEGRVGIEADLQGRISAGSVTYTFEMVDNKLRTVVGEQDLDITHEKKLHLFVFDEALKEFQHVHPAFEGGKWTLPLQFKVNGKYWIWAQGQLHDGGEEFAASARLEIVGGQPANSPAELGNQRSGADGISLLSLSNETLHAGQMAMLDLKFSRADGSSPQITPWLGAPAHVVAVSSDGDSLSHVHPMDHGVRNQLMLHVIFAAAGDYRLWVQFIDGGLLRTVPLSLTVEK